MTLRIVIATHKQYRMPDEDIYIPVQVGKALHSDTDLLYASDDSGDNISVKNAHYCELTALYWAWKNLTADVFGLCHYRRHFRGGRGRNKWDCIANKNQLNLLLTQYDVILPRRRNYFIETTYSQYVHAHHAQDLEVTRDVLSSDYPEYLLAYDGVMGSSSGHRFNMMIMKRPLLDRYCTWLFDILFKVEQRLDISGYTDYDARVFGFLAERLLDVWIETNGVRYTELPVMCMEREHWGRKIFRFLKRKFFAGRTCK